MEGLLGPLPEVGDISTLRFSKGHMEEQNNHTVTAGTRIVLKLKWLSHIKGLSSRGSGGTWLFSPSLWLGAVLDMVFGFLL
jgi:hypothetical protein